MAAAASGSCKQIDDFSQCTGIAYYPMSALMNMEPAVMYEVDEKTTYEQIPLPEEDKKYTFLLLSEPDPTVSAPPKHICLDIRNVIDEIVEQKLTRYGMAPIGAGWTISYFKSENLQIITEKERDCLGSRRVLDYIATIRENYLPTDNAEKYAVRSDFFKAFAVVVKLLLNVPPAQEIIKNNLMKPYDSLFTETTEYKKAPTKRFDETSSLLYNPFCKKERKMTLSENEMKQNNNVYNAFLRRNNVMNLLRSSGATAFSKTTVMDDLDQLINTIKANCLFKFIAVFFEEETKDMHFPSGTNEDSIFQQKIKHCYKFLRQIRSQNDQDNLIRYLDGIFGNVCIRSMGANMVFIMKFLNGLFNTGSIVIPEMNLGIEGAIPAKYMDCFVGLGGELPESVTKILLSLTREYNKEIQGPVGGAVGGGFAGASQRKTLRRRHRRSRRRYEYKTRRSPYLRIAARK